MQVSSSSRKDASANAGSFSKMIGYVFVGLCIAVLVGVLLSAAVVVFSPQARAALPQAPPTYTNQSGAGQVSRR